MQQSVTKTTDKNEYESRATRTPWTEWQEHDTPCQRWKGHPVDDTIAYIHRHGSVRESIRGLHVCRYTERRGYKACHVPAGVLPPGVRSSGPNQPASPNPQPLRRPLRLRSLSSRPRTRPRPRLRDSRFSFSLKCHAPEMGPLDCRPPPTHLLILPDHRTIRAGPDLVVRWLRWLLVTMIPCFSFSSSFFVFFLLLSFFLSFLFNVPLTKI